MLSLERPLVMGILNLTPDSFSDGGELSSVEAAVERGLAMVEQGADLLDLGGESTRPGAPAVEPHLQLRRVLPVLEALVLHTSVPISIDTRSAAVARQALASGASIVNDVSALGDPEMAEVVRDAGAGLVLMHMRGTPQTMQLLAEYDDVVTEVRGELAGALDRALAEGIDAERIVLDPGIGFAKTAEQNLALLGGIDRLATLGRPLLVGPSRKSFIGRILGGAPPRERVAGTVAACVVALLRGARLFRVHDVAPVRQALDVAGAIHQAAPGER
jgi:dihydropteroate synthase